MTELDIPELALVALVGISGSGKSTFARAHFKPTQVLSSDYFRGLVADDENDQSASADAFDVLHYVAGKRLKAGRLTVVDATNLQSHARAGLIAVAREHDVLPVAIVLDVPESLAWARTEARADRTFGRVLLGSPNTCCSAIHLTGGPPMPVKVLFRCETCEAQPDDVTQQPRAQSPQGFLAPF